MACGRAGANAHDRAYGCVYKAIHVATEQEVAIKTVLFGAEEGEGVDEIKKEIDILKRVRGGARAVARGMR